MRICLLLFLLALPVGAEVSPDQVRAAVRQELAPSLELYRWLHAHPELSGQERNTSARLADELRKSELEVIPGVAGTGLLAVLDSGRPGPVVLYRADLDALPITEATGLPYSSQNPGVMHACGHDLHMATAVGVLRVLQRLKSGWSGKVLFVGQPAEEAGEGAASVLKDPGFQNLLERLGKPKAALALHDMAILPAGQVEVTSGWTYANVDGIDIVVHGLGGHGAAPDRTVDPVLIGSEIVVALQSIVARRLPPGERAVVTVGRFQAGTKRNIIPNTAILELTVRSYGDESRQKILGEIQRIATHIARAHGAPRDPEVVQAEDFTPAVFNDPRLAARLRQVIGAAIGQQNVREGVPLTVGEDFSRYSRELGCPAVLLGLGAADPKQFAEVGPERIPGLHTDRWAPAAGPALETGITIAALAILDTLSGEETGIDRP
ncbi:MAG: amidohydrolase [Armatimonadetes bacterium]|nr:amidohydrolase [Armatimonadota bacterium]